MTRTRTPAAKTKSPSRRTSARARSVPDLATRSAGVLLPITALAGPGYVGDLGPEAHAFLKVLAAAGQSWWQMLPVNPIGEGDSPYASLSTFAGETLLISPAFLRQHGWVSAAAWREFRKSAAATGPAAYGKARALRARLLREAYEAARPALAERPDFQAFQEAEREWLDDFTLYQALAADLGQADWTSWPEALRSRDPAALTAARQRLADAIQFAAFGQWQFAEQWRLLRKTAHDLGIGLIGDLPIYVAASSVDVWSHQELFQLDKTGRPTAVAGCPPDSFNPDGQLWGNALYDWSAMADQGFGWWRARLRRLLALFDAVRLDHFIGFQRYWSTPAGAKTAKGGAWCPGPGDGLFRALAAELGLDPSRPSPFIAEDLGSVTPEVRALRDRFGLPGMKVLQFAFDGSAEAREHLPHALPTASVVYTGTHDNDTVLGWYQDLSRRAHGRGTKARAAKRELALVRDYLGLSPTGTKGLARGAIRSVFSSPATVAIIPAQDVLSLSTISRMNVPGTAKGNWRWRLKAPLTDAALDELKRLTQAFDRAPHP